MGYGGYLSGMKKLISMTDFVLEKCNSDVNSDLFYFLCSNYAQFLKQPLTLGMFVPCDEDGNVLEEPLHYKEWCKKSLNVPYCLDLSKYEKYQQAKERVLFGRFVIENIFGNKAICYDDYGNYIYIYEFPSLRIEDLIKCDLTLTKEALKQIGL